MREEELREDELREVARRGVELRRGEGKTELEVRSRREYFYQREHDCTATICQHAAVSNNSYFICLPVHCSTLTFSLGVNRT